MIHQTRTSGWSCYSKTVATLLAATVLVGGCSATSSRVAHDPPSFNKGLDALEAHDFRQASFYFAELAKDGDPAAMNNLGAALLMVDRKAEAVYWFNKATRYGDVNAPNTLRELGQDVPPADLIGKHPSVLIDRQNSELMQNIVMGALIGVAIGVSLKYAYDSGGYYVPSYNPWHNKPSVNPTGLNSYSVSSSDCSSDYACGVGMKCVKKPFSTTGTCMKAVDEYGVQQYDLPSSDSIGIRTDDECSFDTDCPIGFRCHGDYKVCVK